MTNFKKIDTSYPFVKLAEKDDTFIGVLQSIDTRPNRLRKGEMQNIWTCVATEDIGFTVAGRGKAKKKTPIKKGALVQIGEKEMMKNFRMSIDIGQEFKIICLGEKTSEAGFNYQEMEFYIAEPED